MSREWTPARARAAVARSVRAGRRFVVTTHVNPDGDGIGAGLALTRFLRARGRDARLVIAGRVPPQYAWLPRPGEIVTHRGAREEALVRRADAVFVLDLADWRRLGVLERAVRAARGTRVTVDHHPPHENGSDIYWRDMDAAAVGEMIFRLIRDLGGPLTERIATPLYVSLMTDTGCFRFSNTDADAHEMAAALIRAGVRTAEVYSHVYETSRHARLRLMGAMLARLGTAAGGRLAWGAVSRADFRRFGVRDVETEGFIDVIRTLAGVEVSILFKEVRPREVRISFRSRSRVDVNRLAQAFGGGGHARAAGATVVGPLADVTRRVVAAARKAAVRSAE